MICAAIDIIHPQTMRGLVGKDNRHCCGVLRIDTGQPQDLLNGTILDDHPK